MTRRPAWLAATALALIGNAPPRMQDLSVTTVGGERLQFAPDMHEPVIVHYWATWCAPCRVEMPVLDAIATRYRAQGVRVIGIALDAGASRARIAQAGMGVHFPLARLADSNVPRRDVPTSLPRTLVYGRDGTLRYQFGEGGTMLSTAVLDRIIPPLVAER